MPGDEKRTKSPFNQSQLTTRSPQATTSTPVPPVPPIPPIPPPMPQSSRLSKTIATPSTSNCPNCENEDSELMITCEYCKRSYHPYCAKADPDKKIYVCSKCVKAKVAKAQSEKIATQSNAPSSKHSTISTRQKRPNPFIPNPRGTKPADDPSKSKSADKPIVSNPVQSEEPQQADGKKTSEKDRNSVDNVCSTTSSKRLAYLLKLNEEEKKLREAQFKEREQLQKEKHEAEMTLLAQRHELITSKSSGSVTSSEAINRTREAG